MVSKDTQQSSAAFRIVETVSGRYLYLINVTTYKALMIVSPEEQIMEEEAIEEEGEGGTQEQNRGEEDEDHEDGKDIEDDDEGEGENNNLEKDAADVGAHFKERSRGRNKAERLPEGPPALQLLAKSNGSRTLRGLIFAPPKWSRYILIPAKLLSKLSPSPLRSTKRPNRRTC